MATRPGSSQVALKVLELALKMVELQFIEEDPPVIAKQRGIGAERGLAPRVVISIIDTKAPPHNNPFRADFLFQFQFERGQWTGSSIENGQWTGHKHVQPLTYAKTLLRKKPSLVMTWVVIYRGLASHGANEQQTRDGQIDVYFQSPITQTGGRPQAVVNNTRARALQTLKRPLLQYMAKRRLSRPNVSSSAAKNVTTTRRIVRVTRR